jgi:hypothetical protein
VFAYTRAEGIELGLDATEIQVRRPPAGRGGRRAFVSGKKKQNTTKATVTADWQGRTPSVKLLVQVGPDSYMLQVVALSYCGRPVVR